MTDIEVGEITRVLYPRASEDAMERLVREVASLIRASKERGRKKRKCGKLTVYGTECVETAFRKRRIREVE